MKRLKLIRDVLLGKTIVIRKVSDSKIDVHCGKSISQTMLVDSLASALKSVIDRTC